MLLDSHKSEFANSNFACGVCLVFSGFVVVHLLCCCLFGLIYIYIYIYEIPKENFCRTCSSNLELLKLPSGIADVLAINASLQI